MSERKRPRVGEILLEAGVIDQFQLRAALGEQARWGRPLGATLIKLGFLEEHQLVQALAGQLALPMAKLDGKRIPDDVLALVPREIAERAMVIPLFVKREGGRGYLFLGVEDPGNLEVFDDIAFRTGMEIKPVMVGPSEICEAIDRCYDLAAAPEVPGTPENQAISPGTEELARHWSQAATPPTPEATSPVRVSAEPDAPSPADALETAAPASSPTPARAAQPEARVERSQSVGPAVPIRGTVTLHAVIDLLVEKGVMTREELQEKIRDLELSGVGQE